MLARCANSECQASFHYLREGRLFQMEFDEEDRLCPTAPHLQRQYKPVRSERYWLCPACAARFTLAYEIGKGVNLAPLQAARRAGAS